MLPMAKTPPKNDEWDEVEFEPTPVPSGATTDTDTDSLGDLLLDMIADLTRLSVMLEEADADTFKKNATRLKTLLRITERLRTTAPERKRIGFVRTNKVASSKDRR